MHDPEADRFLIEGIEAEDEQSLVRFDLRFRARLIAAARKRGLGRHDAEDVVQETLVAALRQIKERRFERRSSLGHWVGSIFAKRAADFLRKGIRHEQTFVALDARDESKPFVRRPTHALAAPGDDDLPGRVHEALSDLSPRERLVLLLNAREGLPSREIARLLRLGTKTTEAILTAAKKRFRLSIAASQESGDFKRLKE